MSDLTDRLRGEKANLTERKELMVEAADRIEELESGWLPIESAPKDGTKIIIDHNGIVIFGWWRIWGVGYEGWYCTHANLRKPTRWQPLPPPPETAQ